jgi:hypothetical protein
LIVIYRNRCAEGTGRPSVQTARLYLLLIFDAITFNRDDGPDQMDFDRILALGRAGTITLVAPLSVREDVSDTRTQSRPIRKATIPSGRRTRGGPRCARA